jgi:signal transduction histidine kinase
VFAAAAFAVARTVAHRTRHATELAVRAEQLERNSELGARQAVAQERTRLARELHDVIAHSVSVMVVQAGGAERVLTRDPAAASAALRAIQTTGRQALSEMTRLVGILRDADEEIGLAPQPGLADLPALVEQSRAAGIRIDLRAEGDPRPLAPGVELAVYRVAQEALTNIRKHASSAHATVRIKYAAAEISVEIRNSPADASTTGGPGEGGHGLVGMRERVAIYDGHLDAGPLPDGGFRVSARIPAEAQP